MGMTITEKILADHAGEREVEPGQVLEGIMKVFYDPSAGSILQIEPASKTKINPSPFLVLFLGISAEAGGETNEHFKGKVRNPF
jgi:hypothetical protein